MPYEVREDEPGCDGYAVVKTTDNKIVPGGCHETQDQAEAHARALWAAENKEPAVSKTKTFADMPEALVASAAAPGHFEPTVNVGAAPINVPATRLSAAIANDEFSVVMSRSYRSDVAWDVIMDFLSQSAESVPYEATQDDREATYAMLGDTLVVVEREYGRRWTVTVAGDSRARTRQIMAAIEVLLPYPPPPPPPPPLPHNVIPVRFWMQDPMSGGAYSRRRDITVTDWADVATNYAADVRDQLGALAAMRDPAGGKLILMHGPPGTGKTRSILALLSEWRDWCTASVVTDTDRFFGDPTYINSLVFGSDGMSDWMVLVLEDADDYLAVSGREKKGQSISRLLNLADGIVGQGIRLITLMTTNVDVEELNPAVTRNGRCLANVHVGAFPAEEARAWLSAHGVEHTPEDSMTLADMYATVAQHEARQIG